MSKRNSTSELHNIFSPARGSNIYQKIDVCSTSLKEAQIKFLKSNEEAGKRFNNWHKNKKRSLSNNLKSLDRLNDEKNAMTIIASRWFCETNNGKCKNFSLKNTTWHGVFGNEKHDESLCNQSHTQNTTHLCNQKRLRAEMSAPSRERAECLKQYPDLWKHLGS